MCNFATNYARTRAMNLKTLNPGKNKRACYPLSIHKKFNSITIFKHYHNGHFPH